MKAINLVIMQSICMPRKAGHGIWSLLAEKPFGMHNFVDKRKKRRRSSNFLKVQNHIGFKVQQGCCMCVWIFCRESLYLTLVRGGREV